MSRGAVLVAILALAGVASGVVLAARRSAPAPAPSIVTADDPTWCGRPLASSMVGELDDASACGKLSLTGAAPACVFWAECREAHFQIDCASAGAGLCRCDGENGRTVRYDPAFCDLDATNARRSLRAILDSAAVACRWSGR